MTRVRIVAIVFLAGFAVGLLFWPAVLTYTFLAGDRAIARVADCERISSGRTSDLSCQGTWRTADGKTGSGEIYGLFEEDEGRTVEVRIGPMGPYHGGFGRSWALYGTLLPVVLAPPFILVMARRLHGPGKALAAKLLAEPAPFGNLLVVTRDEAIAPQGNTAQGNTAHGNTAHGNAQDGNAREGRRYATAGEAAAPAAYQPVALPGRSGQQVPVSVFEQAAGLGREKSSFWEARGPDGRPMFAVESRSGGSSEPESILIDTGGTARVIIRRISAHPMSFTLLYPNGALLGSILPVKGTNWGAFEVKDQQGNTWARIAARHRTWVARVEPAAPPPFPYVALAFAFDQLRRPPR